MDARPAAIAVTGLQAAYGKSLVISGVDIAVRPGEIAVLLGRNGAGKTTTLRTIAGVHPALTGQVLLDGEDLGRMRAFQRVRHGLALVPSGARAFGALTVRQNLGLVRGREGGSDGWDLDRVYALFPKLRTLQASPSGSLSGGERQMLAVGRALMANPRVIMLDEPSEGLAPVIVQSIATLLRELAGAGIAVLLAEQNHHMAMRVADTCHFIEKGAIARACPVAEARAEGLVERYLGV